MWGITLKELKKNLRDKGTYFYLIAMPVIFILLFAGMYSNLDNQKPEIHWMDLDQTHTSQMMSTQLTSAKGFKFVEEKDLKKAEASMKKGDLTHVVIIPKGFESKLASGEGSGIELLYDPAKDQSVTIVKTFLQNMQSAMQEENLIGMIGMLIQSDEMSQQLRVKPFEIIQKKISSENVDPVTYVVPGYTVMFAFYIVLVMAKAFLDDHSKGMLARISSTPLSRSSYLLGMWIPFILMVLIQVAVLIAFGYFVYNVSIVSIWPFLLLVLGLAFIATTFGLMVLMITPNEKTIMAITQTFVLGGAALGGIWFPIEMLPEFMQKLSNYVPQYWLQQGFVNSMAKTVTFADLAIPYAVSFGLGAVFLGIALLIYPNYVKSARS